MKLKTSVLNFLGFLYLVFSPLISLASVEHQLGGEHRLRGAYFGQDTLMHFDQRIKLDVEFSPNESFESKLWLLSLNEFGSDYFLDFINVYGYGDIKISDEWMLRIGRLPYQLDNNKVFMGGNDYDPVPYVFDGIKINYQTENIVLDVIAFFLPKIYEGASLKRGQYLGNIGFSLKALSLPVQFKTAQVFSMYVFSPNRSRGAQKTNNMFKEALLCANKNSNEMINLCSNSKVKEARKASSQQSSSDDSASFAHHESEPKRRRAHVVRSGIGLEGELSILDYQLNVVTHNSTQANNDYKDFELALDGKIKYTTEFDISFYVAGHYESLKFDPFYYSRHNQSGLLDVVAWGMGTKYGKLGISYQSQDGFTLGVEGVYFYSIGKDSTGYWGDLWNNDDLLDSLLSKNSPLNVFELDILLEKHFVGGFSLQLLGGIFDVTGLQYMQAQLNTKFSF